MGSNVEERQQAEQAASPAPAERQATPARQGRDGLKQAVRGMGYEDGAKALSPVEDPAANDEERRAAELAGYQDALGRLLGGKLYDAVAKHVSPAKVLGYGKSALDGLIEKAAQGTAEERAARDGGDADAIAAELEKDLDARAEEYLASEEGQQLAQAVSTWAGTHPRTIAAAVVLAAVAAVAANVTLPELKRKVHVAKGLDATVKAKLGKVREVALKAIEVRMAYQAGLLKAEGGVARDEKGKVTGDVSASYGDAGAQVAGIATIDAQGVMTARVGGSATRGDVTGEVAGTYSRDKGTGADVKLTYAGRERTVSGGARYDAGTGALSLQLTDEIRKDLYSRSTSMTYSGGQLSGETKDRVGGDTNWLEATRGSKDGLGYAGVAGQLQAGNVTAGGSFRQDESGATGGTVRAQYDTEALTARLDAAFGTEGRTVKTSIEGHPKSGMLVGADAEYNPRDDRLLSYGVHFGFRDPSAFRSFLVEYKRSQAAGIPEDQFAATVEFTVRSMMFRARDETTLRNGSLSSGATSLHAAYPIGKGVMLLGGVTQGYGPQATVGTMPQVGVQIGKIPVMAGYDVNSKAWHVGITIPFGR
jgi:hypothetical protein